MRPSEKKALKREKKLRKLAIQELREKKKAEKKGLTPEQWKAKQKNGSFLRTFVIAFIMFTVVLTPFSMWLDKFLDTNPFLEEGEEEVVFDVMVDPQSPFFREFSDSKRVNILITGVNSGLTDTIMLGSFDPEAKHLDIISIPRDTYYARKGYNGEAEKKINAAFRGDPANTANAVSDVLLGIPINYYAVIEYEDIKKIVDEMGGVPMYIEKNMNYEDPKDTPPLKIHLKAGQQTLSGEDSVKFLRYRKGYTEGDIGRVKAQQIWMKNALSQAIDYGVLKVAKVAFKEVDSNVNYKAMISLGTKAIGLSSDDITTYMLPFTPDPNAPFYVYPKTEEIEDMLRTIYSIKADNGTADDGGSKTAE